MTGPWRLALSWISQHRRRSWSTAVAIAIATSLVVTTIAGYRAAANAASGFASEVLGPWHVMLSPRFAVQPSIDQSLDGDLLAEPAVASLARVSVIHGDIQDVRDTTYYEAWRTAFLGTTASEPPVPLAAGAWLTSDATHSEGPIIGVVSGGLAKRWQMQVGDTAPIHTRGGVFDLLIHGITDEHLAHDVASGVWVRPADADRLAGGGRTADRVMIQLSDRNQAEAVLAAWAPRFEAATPPIVARDLATVANELTGDTTIKRICNMGGAAAVIALLAAAFIVYATASAGASERTRQLAMLRTIGASRGQVTLAVAFESILLAAGGAVLGVLLGYVFTLGLAAALPALIGGGVLPDPLAIAAGLMVAVSAGLFAGLVPAWQAGRSDPLAAMSTASHNTAPTPRLLSTLVGLMLTAVVVVLTATSPATTPAAGGIMLLGQLLALAVATVLVTPALIAAVDRWVTPVVSRCLRVPRDLLSQRLSGGRSAGTVWTLAICLGLSVTMSIWGRTMVAPFLPSPELPPMVITVRPAGLPLAAADEVADLPGLVRQLPLANEQTLLAPSLHGRVGGKVSAATVLVWGLNPTTAFAGDQPMLPVELDGLGEHAADAAIAALAEPGGCLVPEALATRLGLQVGDELELLAIDNATRTVGLEIRGFASLPGWHWVTEFSGMRTLGERPLAPIITSLADAELLGIGRIRQIFTEPEATTTAAAVAEAIKPIAHQHAGAYADPRFGDTVATGVAVQVTDTRDIANRMQTRAGSVIWVLGAIPLATLLVAMLGVAGAIAAGVRARTWEFGVLRTIGLEANTAGRLVLAEAALIAAVAAILSVGFGTLTAWSAVGVSLQAFGAGGSTPALAWPVIDILAACLVTIAAAMVAARGSAKRLAALEPLALLQAGRSSR